MKKILIIFGHENQGFNLSGDSMARCQKAKEVYQELKIDLIICSGGLFSPKQEGIAVSRVMKTWLTVNGIPAEKIIEENESLTTIDNVVKTLRLLPPSSLISEIELFGITSEYHALRVEVVWEIIVGKRIKIFLAESKKSFKRSIVEAAGILVAMSWGFGWKFPEMIFRKLFRSRGKKNQAL